MKIISLYCDATFATEQRQGVYANMLVYQGTQRILTATLQEQSQNRMELLGLIMALEHLKEPCEVHLYSNAEYLHKGIGLWLEKWQARDFTNVLNKTLWLRYQSAVDRHKLTVTKASDIEALTFMQQCRSTIDEEIQKSNQKGKTWII